jgi:hypothetical protein
MARWQTDTPLMRRALALVMLWLIVWAVLGYRNHIAVPTYDQRPGYREAMERCAGSRFEASEAGELYARTPRRLEMLACTEGARAPYLRAELDEQRRVTVRTLAWALVPSLLLLLLAAFGEEVRRLLLPRDPDRS